jgi:hypothetical protein
VPLASVGPTVSIETDRDTGVSSSETVKHDGVTILRQKGKKTMRRREFITLAGGAVAAWPLVARAQKTAMPVVGYLAETAGTADDAPNTAAFLKGLAESGYVEGKNVALEYRWANFKPELLPQLASDLVRRKVNIIFAATPGAVAATRNATTSIPIVAVDLESDPGPVFLHRRRLVKDAAMAASPRLSRACVRGGEAPPQDRRRFRHQRRSRKSID